MEDWEESLASQKKAVGSGGGGSGGGDGRSLFDWTEQAIQV